jgi:hypothetical protein
MVFMQNMTPARRDRPPLGTLFLFAFLLGIGSLLAWTGSHAVRTRHYELAWAADSNAGGAANSAAKIIGQFEGLAAQRVGCGLVCAGAMLILWALCGVWAVLRPSGVVMSATIGRTLCVMSMSFQTAALACLFPPWPSDSGIGLNLWVMIALLGAIVLRIVIVGLGVDRAMRISTNMLIGLAVAGLIATVALGGDRWWIGLVLGVLAAISYGVQSIFLSLFSSKRAKPEMATTQSLPARPERR